MTEEELKKIRRRQAEIQQRIFKDVITNAEAESLEEEIDLMARALYDLRTTVYQIIEAFREGKESLTCWENSKISRLAFQILHEVFTDLEYNALGDRLREEMSPRV